MRRSSLPTLVPLVVALACGDPIQIEEPSPDLRVQVLDPAIAVGATGTLRLENPTASTWYFNVCASTRLQRLVGETWVDAPEPLILCTAEVHTLAAGATHLGAFPVHVGTAPGTYRVRFRFGSEAGEAAYPVSNPFLVP